MPQWTAPVLSPPFPLAMTAREDLENALRAATSSFAKTRNELRGAVTDCAHDLREHHMSPEGTIITIKAFVRCALASDPERKVSDADHFMAEIVRWAILAYFDESDS